MKVLIEFVELTPEQTAQWLRGRDPGGVARVWLEHAGEGGQPGLRWCLGGKVRVRFTGDERELVSVWQMQHLVPYRMRANYGLDLSIAFQDEAIGGTLQVNEGAWRVAGLEDFAYIDGETTVARAKRLGGAIFEAVGA